MGRRKRNNKSTSSSVELARASIDAAAQPLQPTEQSGQQDTPQTQLPKALLQEDAVADQAAKKTQQIKARLSQLLKEQQQGKETLVKLNAELQVGRLCADVVLQ
jgi:small-conductance mechanosensitive channel